MATEKVRVEEEDAKEIRIEEEETYWIGQTIPNGSGGMILFGKGYDGWLRVRICGPGGIVLGEGGLGSGREVAQWLHEWFSQDSTKEAH